MAGLPRFTAKDLYAMLEGPCLLALLATALARERLLDRTRETKGTERMRTKA